jgi:hypothetical protein
MYSPQLPGVRFEGLHAVTPTSLVFSSGKGGVGPKQRSYVQQGDEEGKVMCGG